MAKKLTESQWEDILRRHIVENVGSRQLSKEYGVSESTIRYRAKTAQIAQIKTVANQIVETKDNFSALNSFAQGLTLNLAGRLSNISNEIAEMAELGAGTGKSLFAIVAGQKTKIDFDNPSISKETISAMMALTKLGNDVAAPAFNLLAANKAVIEKMNDPRPVDKPKTLADFYDA